MQYPIQTPVQLGSYLRTRRKALGLTQKEAALRIGLLPKTISALENNPLHCSIEVVAAAFSSGFGIPLARQGGCSSREYVGMRTQTTLDVWMNGTFVGRWSRDKGVHTFEYDVSYVQNPNACPLSLSLPLYQTSVGTFVESFFDNLLPDSFEIRRRLARRFGCASDSAFDILAETGRDCVGALQILKKDSPIPSVRTVEKQALTEHEIELLLLDAVSNNPISVNNDDFFRISIAGAQEKTALLFHDGSWCKSLDATPSTHIIKLPIRAMNSLSLDLHNSVENEWLCLQILQAFGLPVAQADMHDFGNQRVLVVKRFDRKLSGDGSWYVRIPQEDFCQAHGLPSSRKYEVDKGVGYGRVWICSKLPVRLMETERLS